MTRRILAAVALLCALATACLISPLFGGIFSAVLLLVCLYLWREDRVVRRLAIVLVPFVALGACAVVSAGPALAQAAVTAVQAADPTVVPIPYGGYVTTILAGLRDVVITLAVAGAAFASRNAPSWLGAIIKTVLTEQMLTKAVDFAFNTVAGAVKGKTVDVHTGNQLVATGLSFLTAHAPGWFFSWLGGVDGFRDRLIARIPVGEGSLASATTTPTAG